MPHLLISRLISVLDLDSIVSVKDHTVRRTYILELKKPAKDANVNRKAVLFAQERLLEEVTKNGYNTLLQERYVHAICTVDTENGHD